jgi:hypothetical protein
MKVRKTLFLIFVLTISFVSKAQKLISLNPIKVKLNSTFDIKNVKDSRYEKENIGRIIVSSTEKETLVLKGGVESAVKKILLQAIPLSNSLIAISYNILDFKITENRLANGSISGQISLKVGFERLGKRDTVSLVETAISTTYLRSDDKMEMSKYESLVTPLFIKSIDFFDKWLILNGGKHEALIHGVKIVFLPETDVIDEDTVCYDTKKLTWDDFKGKPTNSHYGAAIFSNFAYGANFRVVDGYIEAKIQTKTYMIRGMSWVTSAAHDTYSLAHEQLHFDITKLVVERFKKKVSLLDADLIIDLNSMIQYEYLESYREMNQLQRQFDDETNHSVNRPMQAEWESKVKKWLKDIS